MDQSDSGGRKRHEHDGEQAQHRVHRPCSLAIAVLARVSRATPSTSTPNPAPTKATRWPSEASSTRATTDRTNPDTSTRQPTSLNGSPSIECGCQIEAYPTASLGGNDFATDSAELVPPNANGQGGSPGPQRTRDEAAGS